MSTKYELRRRDVEDALNVGLDYVVSQGTWLPAEKKRALFTATVESFFGEEEGTGDEMVETIVWRQAEMTLSQFREWRARLAREFGAGTPDDGLVASAIFAEVVTVIAVSVGVAQFYRAEGRGMPSVNGIKPTLHCPESLRRLDPAAFAGNLVARSPNNYLPVVASLKDNEVGRMVRKLSHSEAIAIYDMAFTMWPNLPFAGGTLVPHDLGVYLGFIGVLYLPLNEVTALAKAAVGAVQGCHRKLDRYEIELVAERAAGVLQCGF